MEQLQLIDEPADAAVPGPGAPAPASAVTARVVAHGQAAFAALADAVRAAQTGDPLAPVTVVTPSPAVAVTLRRHLARHLGGLAGVDFADLGGVAESLAARHLDEAGLGGGVDREVVTAAVRVSLEHRGGRLGRIGHHRATWEAIATTIDELASLSPEGRAELPSSGLVGELVAIHDDVAERVAVGAGAAVLRLAATVVRAGHVDAARLGPVIVHLPDRATGPMRELLAALAERTSVSVLVGSTGRLEEDVAVLESFGVRSNTATAGSGAAGAGAGVPVEVVSANDLDDEVRSVVRRLLARAEEGVAWTDMALVHPPGPPYARIVADVLGEAGVPASSPATETLAQTAAGRVVTGLLAVAESGFARQQVVDLWATAVVVDADGAPVPFAAFDRTSRLLGIRRRGSEGWQAPIEREVGRLRERMAAGDADDGTGRGGTTDGANRIEIAEALGRAVDVLAVLVESMPAVWDELGTWVAHVLDTLCGPVRARAGWPPHDVDADAAIRTATGRLAALARIEPTPSAALVRDTLRTVLDAPAPRRTRLGLGLFVTSVDRPPLVPLDTVAVVGLVEGQAPRIARDDVLLGDEVRREAGLPTSEQRGLAQRRAFDATVASASGRRILSFARHDQRNGRTQVPSRWLIEALAVATGHRPDTESLMQARPVRGVDVVSSFDASLRAVAAGLAPIDRHERLLAELAGATTPGMHPARGLPTIAAAETMQRQRRSSAFTRFDGNLGGDGVDVTAAGALSPTSLETYAQCPRRWFFAKVLGLGEPDRPEQIDRLEPMTRGSLVHEVLERFFREAIEAGGIPPLGEAWSSADHARLAEIADEACDTLEQRGLTGHRLWWEHDRAEIHNLLHHTLADDVRLRQARGLQPVHVEFGFGDDTPALPVTLDDGRVVALRGHIDRVDLAPGRAAVWDYKHASPTLYEEVSKAEDKGGDPLGGGRRLQLAAYALAVQGRYDVTVIEAHYWFVKPGSEGVIHGYELTDERAERFRRVVDVIATNIDAGRFPPRPGEYSWHRSDFDSCAFCEFTRICPADRDEEWERVRFDPGLRSYDRLATEGSSTVMDDPA